MAKNLKLNIKNTQIAQAINLGGLKEKLAKKKEAEDTEKSSKELAKGQAQKPVKTESEELPKEEAPRIKARSRSAFAEPQSADAKSRAAPGEPPAAKETPEPHAFAEETLEEDENFLKAKAKSLPKRKTSEELRKEIFGEDTAPPAPTFSLEEKEPASPPVKAEEPPAPVQIQKQPEVVKEQEQPKIQPQPQPQSQPKPKAEPEFKKPPEPKVFVTPPPLEAASHRQPPQVAPVKLGPTGRHVKDLLPANYHSKKKADELKAQTEAAAKAPEKKAEEESAEDKAKKLKAKTKGRETMPLDDTSDKAKAAKFKEFRDIKPAKKVEPTRAFDARDRHGLRDSEEDQVWRKRRPKHRMQMQEDVTIRPTSLKVRIPIAIKDLAAEMKLKASQLVQKLFLQGIVATLNDQLEDETTIQLLGHEFGCELTIDTSEEQRLRITDKTIRDEIQNANTEELVIRPPVVAFMGHVDHGKTSLIDKIRESNRAAGEAGAITQHIGAFRCSTPVGDIAILDTPGHEAFSAMRARGADVTDIVVLVVAGDEGIKPQTVEAIQHAKAAKVTIVVAINKADKPNFNAETVYRQLSEIDLLPEVWGGQTITVNCSAVTGQGIPQLLEMLALQAEVLELKANPNSRARGTVLESELHKGMGSVATVLVQNGNLKLGDALVFGQTWGRVKTMRDEFGKELTEAGPSTPVEITGLSGLPEAGEEFIAVKNEREAREIAEGRMQGIKQTSLLLKKKLSMENLFQQASDNTSKKMLNIVLRADVQGSLEALKVALMKIESKKAELNIIFTGVGEVSESDVQLAAASKAVIIGFHTQIESHADSLVKQLGVQVRLHNIIYHAIDDVKGIMGGLLDKIAIETEKGKAEVKATFKSSVYGIIAGCQVIEGTIYRNHSIRVRRGNEVVWKGPIASLKRVKEDVREVTKGLECGIVLNGFNDCKEGDILEDFEITYITQEL